MPPALQAGSLPTDLSGKPCYMYYSNAFSNCIPGWLLFPELPWSSAGKESAYSVGDPDLIPESGKSPREGIGYSLQYSWTSQVAQTVKNLPAVWESWGQSLGWEDPLEKGMATHSGILTWRIPWTEDPGRLQSMGSHINSWTRLSDFHFHFTFHCFLRVVTFDVL